jgi:tetratricopeptide (TPR) repeat protein
MSDTRGLHTTGGAVLVCALLVGFLATESSAAGQADDPIQQARDAETTTEILAAIESLTAEIEANPSPDAYLRLGLAHTQLQQYVRALELFEEATGLYPADSRFLAETAGIHMAERNTAAAVEALNRALVADPTDAYSSDLLASIRLSEGDVEQALAIWNANHQPRIDNIFQNFSPGFLDDAVPRAIAFEPGDVLDYEHWRTTAARLAPTLLYTNVGLEIEPSPNADLYNAIVRTTARTNSASGLLLDLVRELPWEEINLGLSNIRDSGISWQSSFRWDEDRRRLRGRVIAPLPVRGLPVLEFYDTWRSERWGVASQLNDLAGTNPNFDYKVNIIGFEAHAVPHYRVELGGGFEYRNRDASGSIPNLALDERNSGWFRFEAAVRTFDQRFKNKILGEGFIARESILGDFDFSGGSVQIANRYELDEDGRTTLDFSITGGTARGELPVDHYYILGLGSVAQYKLRAHVASDHGRYGQSPTGTDFVLTNAEIRHHLITVPLFGTLGLPFIEVQAMGFYDAAKVFDRQRVFRQGEWLHDVGAGLRFETPMASLTALYGRDTVGGENAFYYYIERRFW